MNDVERSGVVRLGEAESRLPGPGGEHSVSLLRRGTLHLKLSLPVAPNQQAPHTQDELYVIVRGRGALAHADRRDEFEAGDVFWIAAGTDHHFEDFTEDLAVWVVFYGPEGGEVP